MVANHAKVAESLIRMLGLLPFWSGRLVEALGGAAVDVISRSCNGITRRAVKTRSRGFHYKKACSENSRISLADLALVL
jgi:hypothetical protein